jgi:hypothetical protein
VAAEVGISDARAARHALPPRFFASASHSPFAILAAKNWRIEETLNNLLPRD